MKERVPFLEHIAYQMRIWSLKMTTKAGSGHPTSALSAADIVAVLFFHTMHFDPKHYNNPDNDRFILSKGHAAPILYAVWHQLGRLKDKDLLQYRSFTSPLEGHPTLRFAYAEAATGALGIGLSIGLGEALCATLDKRAYRTFVLLGDSEISEGSIWEATQVGAYYKAHNLIGVIDCNNLGQSTPTMEALEGDASERFSRMFTAFGWKTYIVDGHDITNLIKTFDKAYKEKEKPVMVIAKTKKGYGVDLFEGKQGYHGKALNPEELKKALEQLKKRFPKAAAYKQSYSWRPKLPNSKGKVSKIDKITLQKSNYKMGEMIATRKAFGEALAKLGSRCNQVVSLDAEVNNSTFAEIFAKEHPKRFYQCFIAEQNMVGMGIGFDRRGKIPFISTFGAFMTRAHDQIRMGAIGTAALRLVGSHAGVSIGQDGPSQMALEDIAMMRTLPESIILYPCDAVSTHALVQGMAEYSIGISYLRTTRMATPVIYKNDETFSIGGCKILRQSENDAVCIITAGVTIFAALQAYEILKKKKIAVSIIDLYSIKPLDIKTIRSVARTSQKKIITVEDHYMQGGLGSAVIDAVCNDNFKVERLAVTHLPRSGKPEELLKHAEIDAPAIVKLVKKMVS